MKYSTDEAMAEIMRRKISILDRKRKNMNMALSAAAIVLFAMLISTIALIKGSSAESADVSVYGSFILGEEAGGYILVALLAFILGVVVTILCRNYTNKKGENDEKRTD